MIQKLSPGILSSWTLCVLGFALSLGLSASAGPNQDYLRATSPILMELGEVWGLFGEVGKTRADPRIPTLGPRIRAAKSKLGKLSTPKAAQKHRHLLTKVISLEQRQLRLIQVINQKAEQSMSGKIAKEKAMKEMEPLFQEQDSNVQKFNGLVSQLQVETKRLKNTK